MRAWLAAAAATWHFSRAVFVQCRGVIYQQYGIVMRPSHLVCASKRVFNQA